MRYHITKPNLLHVEMLVDPEVSIYMMHLLDVEDAKLCFIWDFRRFNKSIPTNKIVLREFKKKWLLTEMTEKSIPRSFVLYAKTFFGSIRQEYSQAHG